MVSASKRINIVGRDSVSRLRTALAEVDEWARRGDVRALVLRGGGDRAFIGGADIAEMALLDPPSAREFIDGLHQACAGLRELPVPVIAQIRGWCLGAGLEIAASCDLRVAARGSRFGMPEVRVGIPSVIEAALLPGLIGWGPAREMMLTGRIYDEAEALAIHLVEEVVPGEDLVEAVDRRLRWIGECGPRALALQKELFQRWQEEPLSAAIESGIDAFERAYASDEPGSRMRAFLERRVGESMKGEEPKDDDNP